MNNPEALSDIRFLRDVVAKTQPPAVNHFWPVTLGWGCVISVTYLICVLLGMHGRMDVLPWIWPASIALVALPLQWYLVRKVKSRIEHSGLRPRFRKDLMWCWLSITAIGLLWTAGLIISGIMAGHWYILMFVWASLYVMGSVMNGILLSKEWFWAAGVLLGSLIVTFLAGPDYYWLPGFWIGGTSIMAGLLGRRNARARS